MNSWRNGSYDRLMRGGHWLRTDGRVRGNFGLHRKSKEEDYTITHIPSGRAVCGAETVDDANNIVSLLIRIPCDWASADGPRNANPAIALAVKELITP